MSFAVFTCACAQGSSIEPKDDDDAVGDGGAGSGGASAGGSGGAMTTGGAGGGAPSGGASSSASTTGGGSGEGGCAPGADSDADGLADCDEVGDADPWTDALVFNGMHVRLADQCTGSPSCADSDTLAEVTACMATGGVLEEKDQSSGWDFTTQPNDVCAPGYGFNPAWSACTETWQAEWQGFIDLPSAGHHCFAIQGDLDEQCGALFFDAETVAVQTGGVGTCFMVAAGVYPIRWHYMMDNTAQDTHSMQVRYCFDAAAPCVPAAALPSSRLRPTYP